MVEMKRITVEGAATEGGIEVSELRDELQQAADALAQGEAIVRLATEALDDDIDGDIVMEALEGGRERLRAAISKVDEIESTLRRVAIANCVPGVRAKHGPSVMANRANKIARRSRKAVRR